MASSGSNARRTAASRARAIASTGSVIPHIVFGLRLRDHVIVLHHIEAFGAPGGGPRQPRRLRDVPSAPTDAASRVNVAGRVFWHRSCSFSRRYRRTAGGTRGHAPAKNEGGARGRPLLLPVS